jgi:hypothetical protein
MLVTVSTKSEPGAKTSYGRAIGLHSQRPLPGVLAVQKRSLERTQIGNERTTHTNGGVPHDVGNDRASRRRRRGNHRRCGGIGTCSRRRLVVPLHFDIGSCSVLDTVATWLAASLDRYRRYRHGGLAAEQCGDPAIAHRSLQPGHVRRGEMCCCSRERSEGTGAATVALVGAQELLAEVDLAAFER